MEVRWRDARKMERIRRDEEGKKERWGDGEMEVRWGDGSEVERWK